MPGSIQTVPRAELFCLQFLVNEAAEFSVLEFVTDNQKNAQTFNKGLEFGAKSINADLFNNIFKCIKDKQIQIKVRWIPSHLAGKIAKDPTSVIPEFVSLFDIKAND